MAQTGVSFMSINPSEPTPPQNSFSTPFATTIEDENPDEWEYEYSATETETYYLTLDLTTPEVDAKRKAPPEDDRIRTKWTNSNLGRNSRNRKPKPATYSTVTGITKDPDDDTAEVDAEEEELDEEPRPKDASFALKGGDMPGEIQILDLHSSNPIVSYDGHIYSCQWASNVGTELLFTAHNRDSTIPVLRSLPGGVDLLAASSTRLVSNFVEPEPKFRESSPDRTYKRGSQTPLRDQILPIGKWAGAKRKDQGRFLERLVEIKEGKGETDQVTVVALKRMSNAAWRKDFKERRAGEKKKLEGIIKRKSKSAPNGKEVLDAKKRLLEIEEEETKQQQGDLAKGKDADGKRPIRKQPWRKRRGEPIGGQNDKVFIPRKRNRRDGMMGQMDRVPDMEEETPDLESLAAYSPGDEQTGYEQMDDGEELYDEDAPGEEDDTFL